MSNNADAHNRGGFFALIFSVAFCLVFFIYVSFMEKGVDLKEVDESAAAASPAAGGTAAPAIDMTKVAKPWVENADVAAYGKGVYKNTCAVCHGNEGKGDGPAGAALVPPPRNFVEGKWKKGGTSIALFNTLHNGIEGTSMASFKHLPKADRWALVQFVRSITQNKEADDAAKLDAFAATAD